jgi:hypothetical protein
MIEMNTLVPGSHADVRYLRWQPARDDRSKTYRKYPILKNGSSKKKIRRLRFGPPSDDLIRGYEARKDTFQEELYEDTTEQIGDEEKAKLTESEMVDEILRGGIENYVRTHTSTGKYIDKDLISIDYDVTGEAAKRIKKAIEREVDLGDGDSEREETAPA